LIPDAAWDVGFESVREVGSEHPLAEIHSLKRGCHIADIEAEVPPEE